jgi:hypothetical protein
MLNLNIVHLSSSFSGTDKMSVFSFKDILFEFISTVLYRRRELQGAGKTRQSKQKGGVAHGALFGKIMPTHVMISSASKLTILNSLAIRGRKQWVSYGRKL